MLTTWTTIPMLDRLLTDVMSDVTGTAFGTKAAHIQGSFQAGHRRTDERRRDRVRV